MVDRNSTWAVRALARSVALVVLLPLLAVASGGQAQAEEAPSPTASISGTVRGASDQPLAGVDVVPYIWDENTGTYDTVGGDKSTDSNGEFTITEVPAGTYTLFFNPEDGTHAQQWWDGKPSQAAADRFEAPAGAHVVDKDARLESLTPAEGSISGRVTDQDGRSLAGATITVFEYVEYDDEDGYSVEDWVERGSISTAADGSYTMSGLSAGEYGVKSEAPGYVTTWWPQARDQWLADRVDLREAPTATGVDIALERGGTISGRVTAAGVPVEGAVVTAVYWDLECDCGADWVNSDHTDNDGGYAIADLPTGRYTLRFEAPSDSGFIDEWWNDKLDEESADTFGLGSGAALTGKDADLAVGATITGTVAGADGAPLSGVDVVPYLWNEALRTYRTVGGDDGTDANGEFTITGVPEGWYTLQFNSEDGRHASQWWKGQPHEALADRFEARVEAPAKGKDVQLAVGASISGTVTGSGGQPLGDVYVEAHLLLPSGRSEESTASADTDEHGRYTIGTLPAGSYALHFSPSDGVHASKWWGSGDAVLDKGTIMSGAVRDTAGNPVSGAWVCLHWRPTGDGGCGARSGPDGWYTWPGALEPDTYDLSVWIGDFETGARHEVGEVTIDAGVEHKTRDITVDLVAKRRMTSQQMPAPLAIASPPQGEPVVVAEGDTVTGKNIQLGLEGQVEVTGPKPTISGRALVGGVLTAQAGEWTPSGVVLTYQWHRNGKPIASATGRTYRVQVADAGSVLTVAVTGRDEAASASMTSEATAKVPKAKKLTRTPTPTISGKAKVGRTLTAKAGTWKPGTVALDYQWYRSGKAIAGATKSKYKLTSTDKGKRITVRITGTKIGYAPKSKTSRATGKVASGTLTTAKPKILGTRQVGRTLTVKAGSWKPAAVSFRYQWYRGAKKIKGATRPSYTLTGADKGKRITVKVTGSAPGYKTAARKSARTKAVAAGTLQAVTPTIVGPPVTKATLVADSGAWSPAGVRLKYQWYRSGKAINGATTSSYRTELTDFGKTITVKVTGSKAGYRTTSRTSAPVTVGTRQ